MHYSTVLRIIRAGLQGDKETIVIYTKLLADKVEADGDINAAKHLRMYAAENFGRPVHACEEPLPPLAGWFNSHSHGEPNDD